MTQNSIKIGFPQAMRMIRGYASEKIFEQAGSVAFISLYMALFQRFVLGVPVSGAAGIGAGIFLVVLGLAFFIEGLLLGVMPVGEECGLRLPRAVPLPVLLIFAFIIGAAATVAEPAVGILKILGSSVEAWEAPLLFMLLNGRSKELVAAIAAGVGVALFFGILRYYLRLSLKPFLYIIIPLLLLVSAAAHMGEKTRHIISLAWDTGGVTTGPVTVPLIMAIGIGVSRSIGGEHKGMAGFGMITLASAFPILTVFAYGFFAAPEAPFPAAKAAFFAPGEKAAVRALFSSDAEMESYARSRLTKEEADLFLGTSASEGVSAPAAGGPAPKSPARAAAAKLGEAARSILPLSLFLFLVLFALNKGRVRNKDQILLGIVFSVVGMAAFGFGIDAGLAKLGDGTGRNLPVAYTAVPAPGEGIVIPGFDENLVQTAVRGDGGRERYFLFDGKGGPRFVPFDEKSFDGDAKVYVHTPSRGPIFGGRLGGIAVILAFAFFMGYGATIAEPSLKTLGMTVEEISAGAFKRKTLIVSVAIGVGLGMIAGFLKILYDIPIVYLLVPCYLLLLVITAFSAEDFTDIAWDSSGVTTGPITVPLVISMGLGIGGEVGGVEGFGVCAISSLFAILFVMGTGLIVTGRRRAALKER